MAMSVFTNSMPSANSIVTFDVGGSWTRMFAVIPTFASATGLKIEVAVASNATYYVLQQEIPLSTTAQCWPYQLAATLTSGGGVVPLPFSNFQYFRFHTVDSAPAGAVDFKVICSSSY